MKAGKEKQEGLGTKIPASRTFPSNPLPPTGGASTSSSKCHQSVSSSDALMTVSTHAPNPFPKFHLNTNVPGSSLSMCFLQGHISVYNGKFKKGG